MSPAATKAEVTAARNKLVKRYHPDKLSGVDDLGPEFEQLATQKRMEINAAYEVALAAIGNR